MSLDELKQQRANVKKNITRIKNIIESSLRTGAKALSPAEYKCRLGILESYFKQVLTIQTDIEKLDSEDGGRADLEELYLTTKLAIQSQITDDHNVSLLDTTCVMQQSSKLPKLKLPTFSGKYSEYQNFIVSFKQIIDREHSLSNIEKFNHLRNSLQGQALETVDAFQVTNENYPKALDRLKARYDNKTLIFLENISSLFDLPAVTKPNGIQLRSLVDKASAIYGSLLSLGTNRQVSQAMLMYLVLQKSDEQTNKKWKESLDFKTLPTWEECAKVLERHCQYLESTDSAHTSNTVNTKSSTNKPKGQQRGYTFSCSNPPCPICSSSGHRILNCDRFKALSIAQRFENAKKCSLCINCLSKGHQVTHCPSSYRCKICQKHHHTLLHRVSASNQQAVNSSSPTTEATVHTHLNNSSCDNIILATARVLVRDSSGNYQMGKALLDSCSQVNFITDEFSQKLMLSRSKQNLEIQGIGKSSTNIKYRTTTNIKSLVTGFELPLTFCITTHIAYQPDPDIDISSWNIPKNTTLADEQFHVPGKVDLLLGTETFFSLLSVGQIKLGPNLPILQKTLLGWVVSGRYQTTNHVLKNSCLFTANDTLDAKLEKLWKLEEVATTADPWTREQHSCEQLYLNTVSQESCGRVVVRLPFKDNPNSLGDSYATALRRFHAQEQRLEKSHSLKAEYVEFMEEYKSLGHMSVVKNPKVMEPHYYIPHHCVLKPTSTTTKLRVVFDGSCRTTTQKSLNDLQLVGPTLQADLFSLLLRFRLNRYALTVDIVKMYRQVVMHQDDRKYQYILWRSSPSEEILTYQLNTVTYGMASAPYLAIRSLLYLADQHKTKFEIGAEIVKTSFYVDDLLCGANTLAALQQIRKEPPLASTNRITKRSILSFASSLFDPLGLLAPVIITSKILLQELWLLKLNWDETVPQNIEYAWKKFLSETSVLSSIKVPRYCLSVDAQSFQVHGFCDSSIRAYGCAIYTRIVDKYGRTFVRLLTAKSRVAPLKKQSLPKLELCGAVLLARLLAKTISIFSDKSFNIFLWTDSQIVLHWLKMHSATLSTFVGNRISEIQDLTAVARWRHVPTQDNPADIISRGCTVNELSNSMWYDVPKFLYSDMEKWPRNKLDNIDLEVVEIEKRKSVFKSTVSTNFVVETISQRSSYISNVRLIAWILRYSSKLRHISTPNNTDTLSPQELHRALICIVWNIQQQHFANDLILLQQGRVTNSSLRFLNPFLESTEGFLLLKVGGRLELADIPEERKHPILLPSKCDFVLQYIRHLHQKNYHAGPKALVALIRLQFWIMNARDVARKIVRSCIHCVRYKPKLLQQVMGNLPVERLTPSRPFARCGIDFCGPVNVYLRIRGKTRYKAYISIFVCLASKAVHIEPVTDLSTDAFMASLKRMIGRRGLPSDIYCDNATNFVGASNKLAPHFGGIWEAAVKSAKGHLNRSIDNARLTFEELSTVLVEIEAAMNSRPISPLSSDPSDYEALTPAHFFIGSSLQALPEKPISTNIDNLQRWNQITGIKQSFWKRWSQEYINELQVRSKWLSDHTNIKENTMVVIHEDNVPPQKWHIGRVLNCIPGKDFRIRVVDIRTTNGVIRRPIHKLAVLPV